MIIELTLVFDTLDSDDDTQILTLEDVKEYGEDLNIDTARTMVGYQGWRVAILAGAKGFVIDEPKEN